MAAFNRNARVTSEDNSLSHGLYHIASKQARSSETEAFGLPDSKEEPFLQKFLGGILRQVDRVETCVALGQSLNFVGADAGDREVLGPTHPLQSLKALKGDLAASGDELEELGNLLLVEGRNTLKEPDTLL